MAFDHTSHLFTELRNLSERVKRLEERGIARSGTDQTMRRAVKELEKRVVSLEELRASCSSYLRKCILASPAVLIVTANANMGQIADAFLQIVKAVSELK